MNLLDDQFAKFLSIILKGNSIFSQVFQKLYCVLSSKEKFPAKDVLLGHFDSYTSSTTL